MPNPTVKQIKAARERAKRIREFTDAFRRELHVERIAEIHSTTSVETDGRLSIVQLPTRKSQRRAA